MRGKVTREGAFELLDICYDLGGNFIDSASSYQSCESEEWLVQWFEKTGRRGEMVIATKYTMNSTMSLSRQESNFGGTEMEPMDDAVSDSSKRQDRVISISKDFTSHVWYHATGMPERMQFPNSLANRGRVPYLGISKALGWVVGKAHDYDTAK
ncbi:hypothetical protein VUR80DRAFT_6351 [Thermomyces stellatus]